MRGFTWRLLERFYCWEQLSRGSCRLCMDVLLLLVLGWCGAAPRINSWSHAASVMRKTIMGDASPSFRGLWWRLWRASEQRHFSGAADFPHYLVVSTQRAEPGGIMLPHVCTRVNCCDWSSLPHMLLQPWYQLLSMPRNMARAHTFAGGSLLIVFVLRWQSASAAPPPQWCFPVHPCVGGIFLLGEPWSNACCQSHRSNVLISQVFISSHIPNGTHGINVKICMEITWKT